MSLLEYKPKRFMPLPICIFFNLVAAGCLWGFWDAFSHGENAAAVRNWPYLVFIVFVAISSWFAKV